MRGPFSRRFPRSWQTRYRGPSRNRLDLANWLVSQNPLTARLRKSAVASVLRHRPRECWKTSARRASGPHIPGAGLAGGRVYESGERPPLDVRHMIRTIVTSYTYRQTSVSTPALDQRDPDNRLLARQSRFQWTRKWCAIRAANISLLVNKFGGPPVRPYQPDGYLAA